MIRKRDPNTADEVMRELQQEPEFAEQHRARMAERELNRRTYAEAASGLFRDLEEAGFRQPLPELRRVGNPRAVPVLVKWLPLVTYTPLRRDIIATLGSSWARPHSTAPLLDEFRREQAQEAVDTSVCWSIGDALERVADESVLDDLIDISLDRNLGSARGLFVAALGNMKDSKDRVVPILLRLLDDGDVAGYAIMALGKIKAPAVRKSVQGFLKHSDPWIRREAKKALAKLPP